jgi:elongation factor G
LQPASKTPLLLRQIPIWKDGIAIGTIDLASERAYVFREHAESEVIAVPDTDKAREVEARYSMLERLSDHDDTLMEQLLDDIPPPMDEVFDDLAADLRDGSVVPVFIGAAENGNGITRLLKAIRHDGPDSAITAKRPVLQVMKTIHTSHAGKLSVARVLSGSVSDGMEVTGGSAAGKVSGLFTLVGKDAKKIPSAQTGDTVALGKLDAIATGATLGSAKQLATALTGAEKPAPVMSIAVRAKERKDEVKLSAALHRIADEDPSLSVEHNQVTAETIIGGQGEMHLRVALERLSGRYGVAIDTHEPLVAWCETIKGSTQVRGRHKKQSGGHGQFGDVVIEIKPLPRGDGFVFSDTVTGGTVPKQYIPSVEEGVRDYLKSGPLGFPLVDLAVNLSEGSYHTVDSSDMAFQLAAKIAMKDGLSACGSVLLEPVMKVTVTTPESAMASVTTILTQRRGQILGFDARAGWDNWNIIETVMPQSELKGLIVELRSATSGVAGYTAVFDHMAELSGRLADDVIKAHGGQTRAAA